MNHDPLDHEDPIEEVAANWLTLRAEGLSSAQRREFEHWRMADPRHDAAVTRLEAGCTLLEKMPLVRAELQPVVEFPSAARAAHRAVSPRRAFPLARVAAGLAAAAAVMAIGWWQWGPGQPQPLVYTTSAGGYERVRLADGSVLELNATTEVRVNLAPRERRVALMTGEAHFTVAHDAARPFIVAAGGVAVRAVGTAFNIRLGISEVEVLVTEGKVAIGGVEQVKPDAQAARAEADPTRSGQPVGPPPTLLVAHERALISTAPPASSSYSPAPVVERVTPETVREALSWQARNLSFAETPLREVVAHFNRHNRVQLVIGDAALAERAVGGTFAADNVEGFVRLLEGSGAVTAERRDEATIVLRAAR